MNVASLRNALGSRRAKVLLFGGAFALLVSVLALATLARAQGLADCTPYSQPSCADVPVGLPYETTFDGSGRPTDKADKDGQGTGFTTVQPSSNGGAYLPEKLDVDAGTLKATTTKGIQFKTATDGTNATSGSKGNGLDNGLGVGVNAANKVVRYETMITNPPNGSGQSEQAGLWVGTDEDNYAKLVIGSTNATQYRFQLMRERGGVSVGSTTTSSDEVNTANFTLSGKTIKLVLLADATANKVTGYYSIDGGPETQVASAALNSLTVPAGFFDGSYFDGSAALRQPIDGVTSFGGVFTTQRNRAATANPASLVYTFDDFKISESAPPDTTPPAAPAGLSATAGNGQVVLDWSDNTEGDLRGYNVYRSTGTPVPTTGTPLNGATPLAGSAFTDATAQNGTIYNYAVRAVDNTGNASAVSASAGAMPDTAQAPASAIPARVNFQSEAAPVPDGYTRDFGKNYANVRGFGWIDPATGRPLDLSVGGTQNLGNGRDRNDPTPPASTDQRLDTLMHAQADDLPTSFNGTRQEGAWEMALPDGRYEVEVGVGDASPGQDPTSHEVNVEGVKAIDDFATVGTGITAPTGADRFDSNTVVARVADGELTVDAQGGTNTKINYLIVREAPPLDETAPTVEGVLPAENATGVPVGTDVSATFSEGMDATSIDGASFTLAKGNGPNVPSDVSYDAQGRTATLDPNADLDPASSYTATVTIAAKDPAANALASAKTWSFETASDTTAPAVPTGLTATAGEERVDLSWDAVSDDDLAGYNVYRKTGAGEFARVNSDLIPGIAFADAGLNAGTEYVYAVTAVDGAGNESGRSGTQAATPRNVPDTENPTAPGSVRAGGGERKIDLTWDAATDNVGVAGYNVYEGQTKLNGAPISGTSFTHSGLGDAEEHSYVVEAADAAGNTARAAAVTAKTLVAVECPAGACADKTVALPFEAAFGGGNGIHDKDREGTGFRLVQQSSNGGAYLPEKLDVAGGQLKITATSGIQYKNATTGTNATTGSKGNALDNGLGARFDASGKTVRMAVDVINPPGGTNGSQQTGLWFGPNEDNYVKLVVGSGGSSGSTANQHKVQIVREINGASASTTNLATTDEINMTVPTGTPFPDWRNSTINLSLELDSAGRATAFYAVGSGSAQRLGELTVPASWYTAASEGGVFATKRNNTEAGDKIFTLDDYSIEELDRIAPAAPQGLAADAGDAKVDLSWTANGENDLAGYNVYRDGTKLNQAPLTAAAYADTNLTNGTEYAYTVSAVDSAGNESAKSAVRATPQADGPPADTTAPPAPQNLAAAGGDGRATLTWAANTESDLAGYNVYRRTGTGEFARINTSILSAAGYEDSGLTNGTEYTYKVAAVDNSSNESADSNVVAVTPRAAEEPPVEAGTVLEFDRTIAGSVLDKDDEGTGFAGVQPNAAGDEYLKGALDLQAQGGRLVATAQKGTTTGANTLKNGLRLGFDGTEPFVASTRLIGPLTNIATSPQQGAVYVGPNQDNYVKLAAIRNSDAHAIQLFREIDGSSTASTRAEVGYKNFTTAEWDAINTLDLFLTADPATGVVTAEYSIDGGGRQKLPTSTATPTGHPNGSSPTYTVPQASRAAFFNADSKAGIMAFTLAAAEIPVTFDRFAVESYEPPADTTAPAAPQNVVATAGDGRVDLSWTANGENDLAGYNVYRGTSASVDTGGQPLNGAPLAEPRYTDSSAQNGTTYHYVVQAMDKSSNRSAASTSVSATPEAPETGTGFSAKINFQNPAAPVPSGYFRDYGQPFGARTAADQGTGLSYGWIDPSSGQPLDLSTGGTTGPGNGRDRNLNSDQRLDTLMHVQADDIIADGSPATFNGVAREGVWEISVPDGSYEVTVAVGDASATNLVQDPESHVIRAEGTTAVNGFVPSGEAGAATRHQAGTVVTTVNDGRLTLDAQGGTNTKINYADIRPADGGPVEAQPYVNGTIPAAGATNVSRKVDSVVATFLNASNGVDGGTFSSDTVRLVNTTTGVQVPATYGTSGGNDTISLLPRYAEIGRLDANTTYRFEVTDGVRDNAGNKFKPYSMTFTTGSQDTFNPPGVTTGDVGRAGFDEVAQPNVPSKTYTSVTMGPDEKLYAATVTGEIYRFPVAADGMLGQPEIIRTVQNNNNDCNTSTQAANGCTNQRLIMGLTFDPAATAENPVLWISHNSYGFRYVKDFNSKITRLSGPNLENYKDIVDNLPRSSKDHLANSIAFKNGKMYITVGATTAMGAYDDAWRGVERPLAAAVLEVDYKDLENRSAPVDVKTPGKMADGTDTGGTYDPYAAGAPVRVYATGVRNAVDILWHSNGSLYLPTNGSAANGAVPATPADFANLPQCKNRPDGPYDAPAVPEFDSTKDGRMTITKTQDDYLFRVEKGGFYGNPNPSRCEWVLNGGNPTSAKDPGENPQYPVGTMPDRNWRGWAYDFANNKSPNGVVEYQSNNFGGKLKGKMLVVRYSGGNDIVALTPNGANGDVNQQNIGVPGLTLDTVTDPLDLTEDTNNGNLYVTAGVKNPPDGTGKIVLLRARDTGESAPADIKISTDRLITNAVKNTSAVPQSVVVSNVGVSDLRLTGASLSGTDAGQWSIAGAPSSYPVTIKAGEQQIFQVRFDPTSAGPKGAFLNFASDDPDTPAARVKLRGLGTNGLGGSNEPSLQWILDTFEIPVNAGDPNPADNSLPTDAKLGDEVTGMSKLEAAYTDAPVTIEPLAVFGPQDSAGTVTKVGRNTPGQATGGEQLFTVANASYQSLNPSFAGAAGFETADEFGLYSEWPFFNDRRVSSEDALNTWETVAANRHKMRFYPLEDAGGVVPNAFVVATEEHTSGYDYQDVVYIIRNVRAVSSAGEIEVNTKERVFSGVKGTTSTAQTVEVANRGNKPLDLTSVTLAGPNAADFSLATTPAAPTTLQAGEKATFGVRFAPRSTVVGSLEATLRIASNDADEGTTDVGLYGLSTNGEQGSNEPTLSNVVKTLGHPVNVGGTGLILGTNPAPIGDEVTGGLFKKAGSGPVGIKPVARYSPDQLIPFGYYTAGQNGEPNRTTVASMDVGHEQELNPPIASGGANSFDPGAKSFGFFTQGLQNRLAYSQDAQNQVISGQSTAHAVRSYPAKDRSGQAIPNAFIVAFEDATNGDYQDYVFFVTNVAPSDGTEPPTLKTEKFNFQPDQVDPNGRAVATGGTPVATPGGYTKDSGQAFDAARGYGWITPAGTPEDLSLNGRQRTTPADPVLNTLIIMQGKNSAGTAGTATNPVPVAWERTVPNGTYAVKVGVGDSGFFDGTDGVRVEGTQVIPNTQRSAGQAHLSATADVEVTDGKLTLLTSGTNTKLNFVEITGEDTTPPPPPPPSDTKKVNFQPDAATVPTGYAKDSGLGFEATRGYGWVAPGTNNPVNLSAQTRERNLANDQRLDTLVIMQPGEGNPALTAGSWEHALPNGAYEVTLSVGDPGFTNSVHNVNVEGVNAINNYIPTDANKFASATVTANVTDGRLTVDATGGDQTKLNYVDIVPAGDATPDETAPTVSASLGGTRNEAGAYLKRATLTVEAEDNEGGSGIKSLAYSVNGGAFEAYTTPVNFTEAGEYTVVARATDNAGNEATGGEQRFTVVIPPPGRGEIEVENLDGAPFADRLIFNRIQNPEEGTTVKDRDPVTNAPTSYIPPNTVHDVATLRVKNTGPDALSVEELRIGDTSKFRLAEDLPLPAVVKPGASLDVPVRFVYSSTSTTSSLQTGTLTVVSDDSDEPETKVDLAGFWQSQSEGGKEPNFGQIVATYGYGTTVPQGSTINTEGKLMAQGDEILSPYWFAADASKPVAVRQLAAFHTQGSTASFGWTQKNAYNMTNVLTHVGVDGQSFLPRKNDANRTPGLGTFAAPRNTSNTLVPFGFRSDPEHSDYAVNTAQGRAQIDYDQGCVAPCGHHFRTWPALDRSGQPIPNTYLMTMDYAGINYDFQDNVYLVTNIKPENPALDPAAPAPLPGAASLKLEFDKDTPNTLADKNNVGTGFRSTQPNKNDIEPGSDSYKKEFLEMAPAAPGALAVTTSGTTNGAAANGLVNGLRLPFDGSGGEYTMSTRLVGPLNNLGAGQGGVMFGSDQDNFVKVAAINRGTTPSIEFFAERGGNNATANGNGTISTATIPNGGNVGSLDLYLTADRSTGEVRAAYRADGGVLTAMPGKLTLTAAQMGRFFAEQAKAGIIAHHGTATNAPAVLTFDRFAVTPGAPDPAVGGRNALYRLDTGTASGFTYTDVAGSAWTSDAGLYTPSTAINEGNNSDAIENTEDDALYRTYRGNVGSSVAQAQRVLTYNLPTSGAERLDLRLHFAERAHAEVNKRLFDIEVEGKKARTNFDIFNAAGGKNTATALTLDDVAVTDGSLTLALRASVDFPAISAIEVLCEGACPEADRTAPAAPGGLAATGSETGIALDWENNREGDIAGYNVYRSATANGTFTKLNTALLAASQYNDAAAPAGASSFYRVEAVDASGNVSGPATASAARPQAQQAAIRINTGGPAQTVSGVAWRACDLATNCSGFVTGGNRYSENDTITGIPQGMNNAIFQSEWTGGRNSGIPAGGTAFSFNVPVQTGDYKLRLHFAELNKTSVGTRVFDVNVEGGANELTGFDVFKEAGGINKAIVREIPVRVTDGTMNIDFIARVENAKISAIEILPTVQQDTEAPAAPNNLGATASEAGIALDWADNAEADLAGYNVSRSATESGAFTKLNDAPLATSVFNDVEVDAGKTYSYRVTAVDKGGNESGAATDSATMPDATGFNTITWTNTNQNQPQSNSEGQSEVVGGKLYSFGGFDSRKPCCSPTSRAYSYTPAGGWARIANMPAQNGTPYGGVTHAGFTTDGEDIFWAGGYTSNAGGTGQIFGTREAWRYDVSGDRYVKLANLPVDRAGGQLEYLNGKLYYFGGTNLARTQDVGNLYVLDLANQAAGWTERAAMPNGRHHLASAVIGGEVYAIGGQKAHDEALVPQADVHAYDPRSNTWTQKAPMPRAINHATSSTVVMGGRAIVVGGQTTHTTGVADVNAYDPATDAWAALTPLPTPRHSGVAGVLNGNIYLSTGGTNATLRGTPGADTTAPKVAGVQPAENATGVKPGANVQASFNEAMDDASLTAAGNFTLTEDGDNTPVAATVTTGGNKAILDPNSDLEAGKKYTATIKGAVRDAAGNPLGADRTWSFTTAGGEPADTTPPDAPTVRLAAGSDSGASNTDNITSANRPTFNGTAEAGSTVEIFDGNTSLGTGPANGSGDWGFTAPAALADGDRAITARAKDAADNTSAPSAALQLTIDTAAPDTALAASGPSGTVSSASAEFAFSSENGAAFECRLDAGSYAACASPKSYTGLANGQHTFSVRATDRAGNTDASPADRTWTVDVDTTPPTVQSVGPQDAAADVAPGANVTAVFSEAMRASSINGTTFTLKKGATAVNATVAYDAQSRTATLDPAAGLDEGASYTATITTGAQDVAGNALGSARTWSFTTRQPADTTPPAAPAITAPADNGYDTDGGFVVTGTAETNSTVKLFEGTTEVGRATAGSGGNWSVALAGVSEGRHTYAATATDAANNVSPRSGNVTVIVDKTAPAVSDVSPAVQATDVAVGANVRAVFSEDMRASTIDATTFKLVRASDGTPVAAGVSYDAASKTAVLKPDAELNPNTTYTATVTTGVRDAAGNAPANARVWSFTTARPADTTPPTVTDVSPAAQATDVAPATNVAATFSEAVLANTVTAESFTLTTAGGAGVSADVAYDAAGKKATLDPRSDLDAGKVYTATIATTVKDEAGNALANTKAWSFTTKAADPQPTQRPVRIEAGGIGRDANGVRWTACPSATNCGGYVTGGFPYKPTTLPNVAKPVSPASGAVYQQEWTGGEKGPQGTVVPKGAVAFSFDVPVENGGYLVRLHFAEIAQSGVGKRLFDVDVEGGEKELTRFDIFEEAGGMNRAIVREFDTRVTDGEMNIDFIRQVENAKVSAIEILPTANGQPSADKAPPAAPGGLKATASSGGVALDWADNAEADLAGYEVYRADAADGPYARLGGALALGSQFNDATAQAGKTYYYKVFAADQAGNRSAAAAAGAEVPQQRATRVNVGGPAVTDGAIAWSSCSSSTACPISIVGAGKRAVYSGATTSTSLPALFDTGWTGGQSTGRSSGQRAFGFDAYVPQGSYTVRLHFAEKEKSAIGQRYFHVNVEDRRQLTDFDVYRAAGERNKAIVREFTINSIGTNGRIDIDFITRKGDAFVQAVEIIPAAQ